MPCRLYRTDLSATPLKIWLSTGLTWTFGQSVKVCMSPQCSVSSFGVQSCPQVGANKPQVPQVMREMLKLQLAQSLQWKHFPAAELSSVMLFLFSTGPQSVDGLSCWLTLSGSAAACAPLLALSLLSLSFCGVCNNKRREQKENRNGESGHFHCLSAMRQQ